MECLLSPGLRRRTQNWTNSVPTSWLAPQPPPRPLRRRTTPENCHSCSDRPCYLTLSLLVRSCTSVLARNTLLSIFAWFHFVGALKSNRIDSFARENTFSRTRFSFQAWRRRFRARSTFHRWFECHNINHNNNNNHNHNNNNNNHHNHNNNYWETILSKKASFAPWLGLNKCLNFQKCSAQIPVQIT